MSETPDSAEATSINAEVRSYGFMETDNAEETDGALTGWQCDSRTIERSRAFIDRHQTDEEPWFLAVNLLNPHNIMYYTSGDEMTRSRVSPFPDRSVRPPVEDPLYAEDLGYDLFENYGPATFGTRPQAVTEYHLTISEARGISTTPTEVSAAKCRTTTGTAPVTATVISASCSTICERPASSTTHGQTRAKQRTSPSIRQHGASILSGISF